VPNQERVTIGADKGYDVRPFVNALRDRGITPHVAQHTTKRRSALDGRTARHPGYAVSQRVRKRVEEIFGWRRPSRASARRGSEAGAERSSQLTSSPPPTT
jgi:hypothetical protein